MKKEDELRIKGKLDFFLEEKCPVHICRFDRRFWNGFITGKKNEDVYEFKEDKLGDCLLFVADVYSVDIKREVKE